MSNFINPSVLAAEVLDQLEYELVAGNLMYRDRTDEFANVRGKKVGDTVDIRTVTDFTVNEFTGVGPIQTQEINQSKTQLQIEKHFDVSVVVTARERALNLDGIREEIINPVTVALAQKIDTYLLEKVTEAQGLYASNTLLANAADIAQSNKTAILQQISKINRIAVINEDLEATLLGTDVFTNADRRGSDAETALREASLGRLMGTNWFSTVNFPDASHTFSSGTTTLNNTAATANVQGQSALTVAAVTGGFTAGDKITIAGAKRSYTVASNVAANATSIPLEEELSENIRQLGSAAITTVSAGNTVTYQGIYFNPGAFAYATPPLDPANSELAATLSANGFSVRVTEWYNGNTKQTYWSFDLLIGAKMVDPRLGMLLGDF